MFGMRRVVFELAPELRQIHTQIMGFGGIRRAPDLFEEFLAADQLAPIAHQHLEHAPFGRGEMHLGTFLGDLLGGQVDGERLGLDDRLIHFGRRGIAAHGGAQPCEKLVHPKGFGDVVVGAGVQCLDLVRRIGARRQYDHGCREPAAQAGQHLDARYVGQSEVEDHHVGFVLGCGTQRPGTGGRGDDLVASHGQVDSQRAQDVRLVVDHQNSGHRTPIGWGAARSTTTVSPPPGVSPAAMVPPIASTKPRATDIPRPTPVVLSWSPSRWNASKIWSSVPFGIPGPSSMTLIRTRSPTLPALTRTTQLGAYRSALSIRFARTRSSSPASAITTASPTSTLTRSMADR